MGQSHPGKTKAQQPQGAGAGAGAMDRDGNLWCAALIGFRDLCSNVV